jgi:hypothetical protein
MPGQSEEKKLTPVNDALNEGRGNVRLFVMFAVVLVLFILFAVAGITGLPKWPIFVVAVVLFGGNWILTREDDQFPYLYLLSCFQPDRYIPGKYPKDPLTQRMISTVRRLFVRRKQN